MINNTNYAIIVSMNYQLIYNNLCERAKCRYGLTDYTEKHHIIPRSLGGNDRSENLVLLTYREHKLAHRLLTKIYPDKHELITCYRMMSGNITDSGRKILQEHMKKNNPSYKGVWNKGKSIRLRKTEVSKEERESLSIRMKANNPNADGSMRRRITKVESVDKKTSYIFSSLKNAEYEMRKITGGVINHQSVSAHIKKATPYKGYYWTYQ